MMLTFLTLVTSSQLKLRLSTTQKLHEYSLRLKFPQIVLFGEKLPWERSSVFSLFTASNKFFLLPVFGLVVSLGLTINEEQMQFQVTAPQKQLRSVKYWPLHHNSQTHFKRPCGHHHLYYRDLLQDKGSRGWR